MNEQDNEMREEYDFSHAKRGPVVRNFSDNPHYRAVCEYYGELRAERSGVLYIQHIDEGLTVLAAIQASQPAC